MCGFLGGYQAAVFFHIYPKNAWAMVLDSAVQVLQHSPLHACGVKVYYNIPPSYGITFPYAGADPAFVEYEFPEAARDLPHDELTTLSAYYEYCVANPTHIAAYTHDKGTRTGPERDINRFIRQWDWRRLHEYFLFEVPEGCFDAMVLEGYDMCGVLKRDYPLHYSGNFFWARCDYVATLQHPAYFTYPPHDPFFYPELWLGSGNGPPTAYNCFNSGVNHYNHEYPRSLYAGALCDQDVPGMPR